MGHDCSEALSAEPSAVVDATYGPGVDTEAGGEQRVSRGHEPVGPWGLEPEPQPEPRPTGLSESPRRNGPAGRGSSVPTAPPAPHPTARLTPPRQVVLFPGVDARVAYRSCGVNVHLLTQQTPASPPPMPALPGDLQGLGTDLPSPQGQHRARGWRGEGSSGPPEDRDPG